MAAEKEGALWRFLTQPIAGTSADFALKDAAIEEYFALYRRAEPATEQEVEELLRAAEDVLKDAAIIPTWAIKSETDSSAHHHSERRASQYEAKVEDWTNRAASALSALRARRNDAEQNVRGPYGVEPKPVPIGWIVSNDAGTLVIRDEDLANTKMPVIGRCYVEEMTKEQAIKLLASRPRETR